MNDEIKEILDRWKCYIGLTKKFSNNDMELLIVEDIEKVLDYITNLQQENERLKDRCHDLYEENQRLKEEIKTKDEGIKAFAKDLCDTTEEMLDYKSRCEKASDKIQYIIDYGFDYDGFNTVESLKGLIDMLVDYARESKNILQNGSEEK